MRNRLKAFNLLLGILLVLSAIGLVLILKFLDPFRSWLSVVLFYLTLSIFAVSLATFTGFKIRDIFGQKEKAGYYFLISLRQALWFSILIISSLILQSFGLFNFLNAIILVLAFTFLESYFLYST